MSESEQKEQKPWYENVFANALHGVQRGAETIGAGQSIGKALDFSGLGQIDDLGLTQADINMDLGMTSPADLAAVNAPAAAAAPVAGATAATADGLAAQPLTMGG